MKIYSEMKISYPDVKWLIIIITVLTIGLLTNIEMSNVRAADNSTNTLDISNSSVNHVIIIVMENRGYSQIVGSSDAPQQNGSAHKYASASKYYGVYPDSLPNYISIKGGYPYLTKDKDPETMEPLKEQTIVNLLQSKNMTWKGYFEDMPNVCHLKDSGKSGYIVHHNPFVYFDIRNDERCQKYGGAGQFLQGCF